MADNLVQLSLAMDTAVVADAEVNTWSIYTATAKDAATAADVEPKLDEFYTSLEAHWSALLSGAVTVKWYDRADPLPRAPWRTSSFNFGITNTALSSMPAEVALAMSFHAAPVSGVSPARRKGRIYLGPFNAGEGGFSGGRPGDTMRANIALAGGVFQDASAADADWTWQVWSSVDQVGREVVGGHVDNAWDTQRRRGVAPTARSTWTA